MDDIILTIDFPNGDVAFIVVETTVEVIPWQWRPTPCHRAASLAAVGNVLVAGAGLAGTATAIHLAAAGVTVDLIDVSETATALGSGITLQGNALRELRALGVWEQVQAQGYTFSSLGLRAPDPAGTLLAEVPDARSGGPTCRPPAACRGPRSPASCSTGRRRRAPPSGSAPRTRRCARTRTASR